MPDPAVHDAVDALVDAVETRPHQLPLREIVAVQATGHDVVVRATGRRSTAVATPRRASDPRLADLTPRERDVALLVASGYSNQQVATALFVSVATVKDHVVAILRKSGLQSRTQLAAAWYGGLDEDLVP